MRRVAAIWLRRRKLVFQGSSGKVWGLQPSTHLAVGNVELAGPRWTGGLNRSTQHFILEGKDGVWDGTEIS